MSVKVERGEEGEKERGEREGDAIRLPLRAETFGQEEKRKRVHTN